jgi:hypothetical protein
MQRSVCPPGVIPGGQIFVSRTTFCVANFGHLDVRPAVTPVLNQLYCITRSQVLVCLKRLHFSY